MRRGWLEASCAGRFAWLLAFLLLTIGIDPALEQAGLAARGLETALAFALLAGAVGTGARGARIARGLAALFLFMLAGWLVLRVGPDLGLRPSFGSWFDGTCSYRTS